MIRRTMRNFLLFLALSGCGGGNEGEQRQVWRFAIEEIPGSVQDAYAQRFKERIAQRTKGRIEITVYPYGTLGTSQQITEQVRNGALQFAFASPGHLGSVIPEVQLFSLHFLFSEDERVNERLLTSSATLYNQLGAAYDEKGLTLLALIDEGWMVWTGNKPLRGIEDFQGFKIRTMVSPLLLEAYEAYGANPTPMPYGEVYSALQLNMIDGQVNPVFAIEEMSFYEVQKTMTFARHLPFVSTLIANRAFYGALPDEQKRLLREVKMELDGYIFDLQRQYNRERLQAIEQNSEIQLVHLSPSERQALYEASRSVRDRYAELAGARGAAILKALEQERLEAEAN